MRQVVINAKWDKGKWKVEKMTKEKKPTYKELVADLEAANKEAKGYLTELNTIKESSKAWFANAQLRGRIMLFPTTHDGWTAVIGATSKQLLGIIGKGRDADYRFVPHGWNSSLSNAALKEISEAIDELQAKAEVSLAS